jgi:hypothetical protein
MANIHGIKAEVDRSTDKTGNALAAFSEAMDLIQEGQNILRTALAGSTHHTSVTAEHVLQETLGERDVVIGLIRGIISSNDAYKADL